MKINPIIEQLLFKLDELNTTIDVIILIKDRKLIYNISGFYKSDIVEFYENELGVLIAHSRYNQVDTIENFNDLLSLNIQWWQFSKDRNTNWGSPSYGWDKLLVDAGLVTEKIKTNITYSL